MKNILLIIFICFVSYLKGFSQGNDSLNSIKLFNDIQYLGTLNPRLDDNQQTRLYNKITQLINKSGVAEIGYSTFYVAPQLDIISVTTDETVVAKIYLAETELFLSINRVNINGKIDATFKSTSKKIMGSGRSKEDALNNAINQINSNDAEIISFIKISKQDILNYYKKNCNDVIAQGDRAKDVRDFVRAMSLYSSVPNGAPCYKEAMDKSVGVYMNFIQDDCNKKVIKMKSYIALSQSENTFNKNYFDSALKVFDGILPGADQCFMEANNLIRKVETRLDEKQKQNWEYKLKIAGDVTEIEKSRYKAIVELSKNYHPDATTNIIIKD